MTPRLVDKVTELVLAFSLPARRILYARLVLHFDGFPDESFLHIAVLTRLSFLLANSNRVCTKKGLEGECGLTFEKVALNDLAGL